MKTTAEQRARLVELADKAVTVEYTEGPLGTVVNFDAAIAREAFHNATDPDTIRALCEDLEESNALLWMMINKNLFHGEGGDIVCPCCEHADCACSCRLAKYLSPPSAEDAGPRRREQSDK